MCNRGHSSEALQILCTRLHCCAPQSFLRCSTPHSLHRSRHRQFWSPSWVHVFNSRVHFLHVTRGILLSMHRIQQLHGDIPGMHGPQDITKHHSAPTSCPGYHTAPLSYHLMPRISHSSTQRQPHAQHITAPLSNNLMPGNHTAPLSDNLNSITRSAGCSIVTITLADSCPN